MSELNIIYFSLSYNTFCFMYILFHCYLGQLEAHQIQPRKISALYTVAAHVQFFFFMSSRCSLKLQVEPALCASLIHWAAHEITFISENSFFYLELQIWHGPQWSPSRSESQSPGYCWVSGSGWSSSHCSPPGRHKQVSYTQKVKWFHIKWFLVFRGVPLRFIVIKSKLRSIWHPNCH